MKNFNVLCKFLGIFILSMLLFVSCGDKEGKEEDDDKPGIKIYKDLSYGKSSAQKLDMVLPDNPKYIKEPLNVLLFIHGGGWQEGDKNVYNNAIIENAEKLKFLMAAMNYRMFGDGAKCSDMLEDVNTAITFIKKQANDKGLKVNKIILMGASAGGHLSLLYTYKHYSTSAIPIAFCVSQSAPTDFTDSNMYTSPQFGNYMLTCASNLTGKSITKDNYTQHTETLLSISPINYVKKGIPPTLMAHGRNDILVPYSNATLLFQKLSDVHLPAEFYSYDNSGHELDNDPVINETFFKRMFEYIVLYM